MDFLLVIAFSLFPILSNIIISFFLPVVFSSFILLSYASIIFGTHHIYLAENILLVSTTYSLLLLPYYTVLNNHAVLTSVCNSPNALSSCQFVFHTACHSTCYFASQQLQDRYIPINYSSLLLPANNTVAEFVAGIPQSPLLVIFHLINLSLLLLL